MVDKSFITIAVTSFVILCVTGQDPQYVDVLISQDKPVNLSSTLSYSGHTWAAAFAVDGNTNQTADGCKCCAGSQTANIDENLTLDLRSRYNISRIVILGRTDHANGLLTQTEVYLRNQNNLARKWIHTVQSADQKTNKDDFSVAENEAYQYVIVVSKSASTFLIICEIQVFTKECKDGYYGTCITQCGNCANADKCDKTDGNCPNGCEAGYQGNRCDEECQDGFYGNCSTRCGNCKGTDFCNKMNGECPNGCSAGYHEVYCTKECDPGKYGEDCTQECGHCKGGDVCDIFDGSCSACEPGYTGETCQIPCEWGKYGDRCAFTCGHCFNNETCNKATGRCDHGCGNGYTDTYCNKTCEDGKYGPNCQDICGNCKDNLVCDIFDGSCTDGCAAGYKGPVCKTNCSLGEFGENCTQTCHCYNNAPCDPKNGTCSNGICEFGYAGIACDEDLNIIPVYRDVITVTMSSTFNDAWKAERAIDGNPGPNADACQCCSATDDEANSYWQINFGTKIPVMNVQIYARIPVQQIADSNIYLMNGTGVTSFQPFRTLNNVSFNNISVPDTLVETIRIQRRTGILTLCEVKMYRGACSLGRYGPGCSNECHCFDNKSCDFVSGECQTPMCKAGWQGAACNQTCNDSKFGQNCSRTCHCFSNDTCDNFNGQCWNGLCAAGWQGLSCDQECGHARFGSNCSSTCNCYLNASCGHITGVCVNGRCSPGWTGKSCNTECSHPTFGQNCAETCHCKDNSTCDPIDGTCANDLCESGWKSKSCNQECSDKTFGENCSTTCNCVNDCHHIHGNCTLGGCLDGWEGSTCTVRVVAPPEDGSSPAPIIGGVIGAVILCVIVVAAFLFIRRRRRNNADYANGKVPFKNINATKPNIKHEEADFPDVGLNVNNGDSSHVEDPIYTNESQGIKIHELWNYIKLKSVDNCKDFFEEYKAVPKKMNKPAHAAVLPGNIGKNRYKEMHPYDENRVQLTKTEAGEGDYINASYIDGVNFKRKFIASQGPQEYMVDDFWRMIWDKKARKIIMLTNVYDNDSSRKIVQYWSDDGSMEYGKLSISVLKCVNKEDYAIRDMRITHEDGSTHDVKQFHFKSWPDKDVPSTAWSLVHFWRLVNETGTPKQPGKIVVHCSAGVGRTGTYIALDVLYNEAIANGEINPIETLRSLREQRILMVQTKEQYVFLHEAVAEALNFGTHHVLQSQFEDIFSYMMGNLESSTKSRLQQQYELLLTSLDQPMPGNTAEVPYGNIGSAESEINAYKPSSGTWNPDIYSDSGAISLPLYTGENGLIICKLPSDSRINNFWKMVQEGNIKTVVFIQEKSKHQSPSSTVNLFEFTNWRKGQPAPKVPSEMLNFLESIMKWQPKVKVAQPIIVCCSDGVTQSGMLCVLLNELYRMKHTNGQINIVESVKMMKHRNRKIIPDFSQYKFCYDVIREACQPTDDATESHDLTYENEQLYQNV